MQPLKGRSREPAIQRPLGNTICADNLYNVRSILRDHRRVGDEVFDRFTGEKEGTLWYYRSLADALARSGLESWLVDELERTVRALERAAGAG